MQQEKRPMGLITNLMLLLMMMHTTMSFGSKTDVACLKSIYQTIEDPKGSLISWNFSNPTEEFMCGFDGIDCWNDGENKVLSISLSNLGLRGAFPRGIAKCTSLTYLDLSSNHLSGEIPSDICNLVPFLTTLKLSSNDFYGQIPNGLLNCSFLNMLELNNNQLSGQLPTEIGFLSRLRQFTVANNDLYGSIPVEIGARFPATSFAKNEMLCGSPLAPCRTLIHTPEFLTGAGVSGVFSCALSFVMGIYFFICQVPKNTKEGESEGNKIARRIKWNRIKVNKSVSSLKESEFKELAKGTNNFSKEHIFGFGKAGTMTLYRVALKNGRLYTVKRSEYTNRLLREYRIKMSTMGSVRHPNLVPLLGYCVANKELFSVYDHMPNGSLYDHLHSSAENCSVKDSPLIRLKIGVGAAKGLAWLHHDCNPRIIHQNISSRSILLDGNFIPKISDFGLVTLENSINQNSGNSGYLAPENARSQIKSPKRDVYSFGVVLLEIITGEMPDHVEIARFNGSLIEWIMQLSNNSNLEEAVDRGLVGKGFDNELVEFLKIGFTCLTMDPSQRPSMYQVHRLLTAILDQACKVDDEV